MTLKPFQQIERLRNLAVCLKRSLPVRLQSENGLDCLRLLRSLPMKEPSRIFTQDVLHRSVGRPAQLCPEDLVDIVIAPFGVGDKAAIQPFEVPIDVRELSWARADWLTPFCQRKHRVPLRHRKLSMHR